MNLQTHQRISSAAWEKNGFALVVTLSLMILLTLIAVGLLSLSAVSLRSSSQGMAQVEAKANARLALMLAIGDLQKEMGPDQRISARAEILDHTPDDIKVDGVANPHYLGVWDSWDSWLTDNKGSLTIQDTYKRGRDPSLFKGWLVSSAYSDQYAYALKSSAPEEMVVVCGPGSAGSDPANHVEVPLVEAVGDNGVVDGRYAWWVTDESQKVRLDLLPRDEPSSVDEALASSSHTGRMGVEKLGKMQGFDTAPESLAKMITTGQARLSAEGATEHFHGITAHSLGLLTDVRSGGFKSDLNLAFESDVIPKGMDGADIFNGRSFDAPTRSMTGKLASIQPQNPYIAPMSWRQLREFYRVYRKFSGDEIKGPVEWVNGKPETKRFVMVDQPYKWDKAGYMRQLVMLRQNWVLATASVNNPKMPGGIEYHIYAIPVVYVWNPYNVAMRIQSREISYLGVMYSAFGMWHRVYRGSTKIQDMAFPNNFNLGGQQPNRGLINTQYGYRMMVSAGSGGRDVVFEPGQVRVFSTNDEIVNQGAGSHANTDWFDATPGYKPIESLPGIRGLKCVVYSGTASEVAKGNLSVALRLSDASTGDGYYYGGSRSSAFVWHNHEPDMATQGAYNEDGSLLKHIQDGGYAEEWQRVSYMGGTCVDWLGAANVNNAWIIQDAAVLRARWDGVPGDPPMPIGIISITAKCGEQLQYDGGASSYTADFRNRTWLHAPHSRLTHFLMNPTELNRADFPYQVHFRPVNGDQELSFYLQADGNNGFFGGGYTPADGQTHLSCHSLPVSPTTSLASFAGIRVDHASARVKQVNDKAGNPSVQLPTQNEYRDRGYYNYKHMAHPGGAFGLGIGNAYAHPMIEATGVYTRNNFGTDPAENSTYLPVTDDYWDHLFLSNEELWDSWFCSNIVPVMDEGRVQVSKEQLARSFFAGDESPLPRHYLPYLGEKTRKEIEGLVATTNAAVGENGWDVIGARILNKGQFNVNSTSKAAWKAMLMSLSERAVAADETGSNASVVEGGDQVTLSRHPLANGKGAGAGPDDDLAWRGIQNLTEPQIDRLAEEIVKQVKLRGPFLNMTEFINRRLSNDELGVTGALQAAIDWDEFDSGYNGNTTSGGVRINEAYKEASSMILSSELPARYPNPKAATGSRFAGIPGYVMQSDILQGIGNSLSVRGDTFMIRAYGESVSASGEVKARAWCEAVVQRMPMYCDDADVVDKKMRFTDRSPDDTPDLQPANEKFGRRFEISSFRWLNPEEV